MVWYGMVWYGMVWYGMVWYAMVWYGMVGYGMPPKPGRAVSGPLGLLSSCGQSQAAMGPTALQWDENHPLGCGGL